MLQSNGSHPLLHASYSDARLAHWFPRIPSVATTWLPSHCYGPNSMGATSSRGHSLIFPAVNFPSTLCFSQDGCVGAFLHSWASFCPWVPPSWKLYAHQGSGRDTQMSTQEIEEKDQSSKCCAYSWGGVAEVTRNGRHPGASSDSLVAEGGKPTQARRCEGPWGDALSSTRSSSPLCLS